MTDVQFSSVKENPSCSRLGTVVGLSASAQMIWLITIVIFLGAVVTVMLVFWFFSQRERILAALRKPAACYRNTSHFPVQRHKFRLADVGLWQR